MKLTKQPSVDRSVVTDACIARQPIFGTAGEVVGYELLYRRTATPAAGARRGAMATDVAVHSFLHIGLDRLTAGRAAFLNFTREMLLGGIHSLLPPEHVVVELLEDVQPDEQVEAACERLIDAGYALALGDYSDAAHFGRLLELATIVKVDVLNQPPGRLDEIAQDLATYDVRLLAERVETPEVRALCAGLGYELFQGGYYARPEIARNRALLNDELSIIRALAVVRDPRATDADAEAAFGLDVGLRDRLLRMVNSSARGGRTIGSIGHAVQLSGREEVSKWLALLLVSSMAANGSANRELLRLAMQRARLCELLAMPAGRSRDANACFLVGLFSLLDAISGLPMADLLDVAALAGPLRDALIARTGPYAMPLSIAEAYERGEWGAVARQAPAAGLDAAIVGTLYVQSLAWTRNRLLSLTAA